MRQVPDEELVELTTLTYDNAADKRRATNYLQSRGFWRRFQERKEELRLSKACPIAECWRRTMQELVDDLIDRGITLPYVPDDKYKNREGGEMEAIALLMEAAKDRRCSRLEEIEWVVCNIPRLWEDIDESEVPSDLAVSLLVWAKDHPGEFHRSFTTKLIPVRSRVERTPFVDENRTLALLDR